MRLFKTITGWTSTLLVGLFLFSLTACDDGKLSDPEIASVVVAANQIDVDYGKLALEKSTNSIVKEFAQTMIKDHEDIIKQTTALAGKLGVTPKDNEMTQSLLDGQKKVLDNLNALEGEDFDKAYIKNEADYHDAVVSAVKDKLIPDAKNADLKQALEDVLPLLEAHLEMAKADSQKVANGEGNIPQFTDPQIASIVVAANQIDVNYGKIALKKSKNKDVRHFAQTMITDHENIVKAAGELAEKLGVTPDDENDLTQSLLDQAKETTAKLEGLSGDEFNKAYIQNEVDFHDAVISAVKDLLIPQTDNEELKNTMIDVTPLLEEHLKMANEANAKINN